MRVSEVPDHACRSTSGSVRRFLSSLFTGLVLCLGACGGPDIEGRSLDSWLEDVDADVKPQRERAVLVLDKHPEAFRDSESRLEALFASTQPEGRNLGARIAIQLGESDDAAMQSLLAVVCANRIPGPEFGRAVGLFSKAQAPLRREFETELVRTIDRDPEAARRALQFLSREAGVNRELRIVLTRTLATKGSEDRAVVRAVIESIRTSGTVLRSEIRGLEPFVERVRTRGATHAECAAALGVLGGAEAFARLVSWTQGIERKRNGRLDPDQAIDLAATLDGMSACVGHGDLSAAESLLLRTRAREFALDRECDEAAVRAFVASTVSAPLELEEARAWWMLALARESTGEKRIRILEQLAGAVRDERFSAAELWTAEAIAGIDGVEGAVTEWFGMLPPQQILALIGHDLVVESFRDTVLESAGEVTLQRLRDAEAAQGEALGLLTSTLLQQSTWPKADRWVTALAESAPESITANWPEVAAAETAAQALARTAPDAFAELITNQRASWLMFAPESALAPARALLSAALEHAPALAAIPVLDPVGGLNDLTPSDRLLQLVELTADRERDDSESAPFEPRPKRPVLWFARSVQRLERLLPESWPETAADVFWIDSAGIVLERAEDPKRRPPRAVRVWLQVSGEPKPVAGQALTVWIELLKTNR